MYQTLYATPIWPIDAAVRCYQPNYRIWNLNGFDFIAYVSCVLIAEGSRFLRSLSASARILSRPLALKVIFTLVFWSCLVCEFAIKLEYLLISHGQVWKSFFDLQLS